MVSGDYYDFMTLPHKLGFAIGDVAGKGISAALLMATIQSTMRTQFSPVNGAGSMQPSTAQRRDDVKPAALRHHLGGKVRHLLLSAYLTKIASTMHYTNAGHLPPLLLRNGESTTLDPTGTVVGAFANSSYEERSVHMQSGDVLVAYTDGITEPENEYDEMFGEQRLLDLLMKFERADSDEMIARTMEAVHQWSHAPEQPDDMTMIVARRI